MSIDSLRTALPAFAKEQKRNLDALLTADRLSERQLWGALVAAAAATRSDTVLREILDDAPAHLSAAQIDAALGAATSMAANNVAHRTRHFLGDAFLDQRVGLRLSVITGPGVHAVDVELCALAASAINGCEACVREHADAAIAAGLAHEQVWEVVKVAAVMEAVAQALQIVRGCKGL